MEKPALFKAITVGGLALVGFALCNTALTTGERRRLVQRDNGKCQWNLDDSKCEGGLEASHTNHSREDILIDGEVVRYNNMRRCLLLCTKHHLMYHQMVRPEAQGLTEEQNDWAINKIKERLNF